MIAVTKQARDHARRMSTATHEPECEWHLWLEQPSRRQPQPVFEEVEQDGRMCLRWVGRHAPEPPAECAGCVTDEERALWRQIADEYDRHAPTTRTAKHVAAARAEIRQATKTEETP